MASPPDQVVASKWSKFSDGVVRRYESRNRREFEKLISREIQDHPNGGQHRREGHS